MKDKSALENSAMSSFHVETFRQRFPMFHPTSSAKDIVYFDNAATTQKFASVLSTTKDFYQHYNANVHRGSHQLSSMATDKYEQARKRVQSFINAKYTEEIIWTKGTTEALNLLAMTIGEQKVSAADDIVISAAEHHANLVCWQQLAKRKGANLVVLPLTDNGTIDLNKAAQHIGNRCRILAINHVSNVVGKRNDINAIIALARKVNALVIVDGAQSIAHFDIDVQALDCDFFVFSGHKIYAPTGIGVLYGKKALLTSMPPYHYGGEMIKHVSFADTVINDLPHKFEAGTPNIAGVLGLASAINELAAIDFLQVWESQLTDYAYQQLKTIPQVQLLFSGCPDIPLFSFTILGIHHQDVASYLDGHNIAVRAGHHCAMPLLASLGLQGSVRMSLAPYNTLTEIDYVIQCLRQCIIELCETEQSANGHNIAKNTLTAQSETCQAEDISGLSNDDKSIPKSRVNANADSANYQQVTLLSSDDILSQFAECKGWDQRHRQIMLLSKQLPRIDKAERSDDLLISGCESKAWLKQEQIGELYFYRGDSDARLIRGLMVVIFSLFQGKTAGSVTNLDVSQFFDALGLLQHLSPSRGNGVRAIVEKLLRLQTSA